MTEQETITPPIEQPSEPIRSSRFKLNTPDIIKLHKGAAIALGGALIVYLMELLPNLRFGVYTPFAVALVSVIINLIRKWITNNSPIPN